MRPAAQQPAWLNPLSQDFFGPVTDPTPARMWRSFMAARVLVAVVLLTSQLVSLSRDARHSGWLVTLCVLYLLASVAFALMAKPQANLRFDAQWLPTAGVDLVVFGVLQVFQAGTLNYSPLLALPLLMASVMGSFTVALATAAAASLLLLGEAWLYSQQAGNTQTDRFFQAALTGTGYFVVSALVHQLAVRLGREEQLAQRSQLVARQQGEINALVIETLSEGVLIMDRLGTARAANPAAMRLLSNGLFQPSHSQSLMGDPAFKPLVQLAQRSFMRGAQESGEIIIERLGQNMQRLQARTRLTGNAGAADEVLCVLFLQDLRDMELRLHTERLAVMGRMSAAVAHEIRNPLAAISQANALLDEELQDPAQRRLTNMVAQNAQRLSAIVEDILQVARVQQSLPQLPQRALPLDDTARAIASEWAGQNGAGRRMTLDLAAADVAVSFDADHLRRVLVNLLDNALRYASPLRDAIVVRTRRLGPHNAHLAVWSDGPLINDSIRARLFEPFSSSDSRSSGLGLYICRELCQRHGASVAYRVMEHEGRQGNEFHINLRAELIKGQPTLL